MYPWKNKWVQISKTPLWVYDYILIWWWISPFFLVCISPSSFLPQLPQVPLGGRRSVAGHGRAGLHLWLAELLHHSLLGRGPWRAGDMGYATNSKFALLGDGEFKLEFMAILTGKIWTRGFKTLDLGVSSCQTNPYNGETWEPFWITDYVTWKDREIDQLGNAF